MLSIRPASGTIFRATSSLARPVLAPNASSALFGAAFRRTAATKATTADEALEILKAQRKNRPLSPDLTIYKFPIGGVLSGAHRISGVVLAFGVYGFFGSYALLTAFGQTFDSNSIAAAFGALPLVAKLPLKFLTALPFTYHGINGFRHLYWDFTTKSLTKTGVVKSSKAVIGISAVLAAIVTFL